MQKNVGTIDAIMRITCGLVGLVWSTSRLTRHPMRIFPLFVAMMSGMKVAEGIIGFCPMKAMFSGNKSNTHDDSLVTHQYLSSQLQNETN